MRCPANVFAGIASPNFVYLREQQRIYRLPTCMSLRWEAAMRRKPRHSIASVGGFLNVGDSCVVIGPASLALADGNGT